ncbi:MAG: hypothetical protein HC886_04185 [Leptolyngbyaceae cyanobacterium SM1_1_3]|nr:hypothetical protein [Leptolyngbyaceae cyanobacterium SM1_1_3]
MGRTNKGQSYSNTLTSLGLLLMFGILSLLSYALRDYDQWIVAAFALLWWLDVGLAKQQYFAGQSYQQVAVEADADELEVTIEGIGQTPYREKIRRSQVDHISIERAEVQGGAFKETLTYIWQGRIILRDGAGYLVFEKHSALIALKAANKLAHCLEDIPVIFAHSQGISAQAMEPLSPQAIQRYQQYGASTIYLQRRQQQWHLFSRWNSSSSWRMIKEALQQSGFLLFVVLTTKFMAQTGELLHQMLLPSDSPAVIFLPSLSGFSPRWLDWLEIAIAFGLIVWKGLEISQEEHFYINTKQLTFCINRRQVAQLTTAQISTLLYLQLPKPMLLIADHNQAIEITGLQTEAEFQTLLVKLEQAIRQSQHSEPPKST